MPWPVSSPGPWESCLQETGHSSQTVRRTDLRCLQTHVDGCVQSYQGGCVAEVGSAISCLTAASSSVFLGPARLPVCEWKALKPFSFSSAEGHEKWHPGVASLSAPLTDRATLPSSSPLEVLRLVTRCHHNQVEATPRIQRWLWRRSGWEMN